MQKKIVLSTPSGPARQPKRPNGRRFVKPVIEPSLPQSQSISSSGLLCYYPFNGNVEDESGNELHGKVYGAILTTDRFGVPDSAYHFDGKGNYIEIPNSAHLNPVNGLTVTTWVKLTGQLKQRENVIVSKFLSGRQRCYSLYINAKRLPVAYIAGIRMKGKTLLSIGEWYLLTETWDGHQWQLYVNGQLEASKPCNSVPGDDQNICIGRTSGPHTPAWFLGDIDDVGIYDVALSSQQVLEMYNGDNGNGPKTIAKETIKNENGLTVKEHGRVKMWGKIE